MLRFFKQGVPPRRFRSSAESLFHCASIAPDNFSGVVNGVWWYPGHIEMTFNPFSESSLLKFNSIANVKCFFFKFTAKYPQRHQRRISNSYMDPYSSMQYGPKCCWWKLCVLSLSWPNREIRVSHGHDPWNWRPSLADNQKVAARNRVLLDRWFQHCLLLPRGLYKKRWMYHMFNRWIFHFISAIIFKFKKFIALFPHLARISFSQI